MSEEQRSQAPLGASFHLPEEQLRLLEVTAGTGIFELDLATQRISTTPYVAVLFGFDPGVPRPSLDDWMAAVFPDDVRKLRAEIEAAERSGVFSAEFRVRHSGDHVHWLVLKGDMVRDAGGRARWLRGTCYDVTERKTLEARLLALNETLEAHVRERTQQLEERTQQLETSLGELRDSERRFRLLVEAVTDYAIFMLDPGGHVVKWNPGAERIKGYRADEIIGQHISRFYTEEDRRKGVPAAIIATASSQGKFQGEGWRVRKNGTLFWASIVIDAIHDEQGALIGFAKVTRDLTERRAAEERLRQSQKMEAIGQLTGGVAHDFNNLLTVVSGNLEALQRRLGHDDRNLQRLVNSAMLASSRAAILTHQLLAFSRRQPLQPKAVSVNTLLTGMLELIRRILPESIIVETVLAGGVWSTFVDANQLENCLLNLAVNARDAMPDGGKLTFEAANVLLDEDYAIGAEIPSGQYVGVFVSDTGMGMTKDVSAKAFEPFFTTKDVGQGTGLGLSQVYGFVRQSGGHVRIYSEVGVGTTVKIYLPRLVASTDESAGQRNEPVVPHGNGETILVVEDEPGVRSFAVDTLRELGYRVLEAPDGARALRVLDSDRGVVLMLTDVGLPGGMNGRQLADEARGRKAALKVLFTSGYARNAIVHHGRLDAGVEFITKPFTFAGLAAKVRNVLDNST